MDIYVLFAVSFFVAIAAVLRGITGFGFALIAVPLLALFLSPEDAVCIVVLVQASIAVFDISSLRSLVKWRGVSILSIGVILGTPVGIALLSVLNPDVVRILIGSAIILTIPFLLKSSLSQRSERKSYGVVAGILSGVLGGLAAIPGPPVIIYYLTSGMPAEAIRASMIIVFGVSAAIAAPGLYISGFLGLSEAVYALLAVPIVLIGTRIGRSIFLRAPEYAYRRFALVTLAIIAVTTISRGIYELL